MIIQKLQITEEERNLAVQEWLERQGVKVTVTNVDKDYSYSRMLTVECETIKPEPIPAPTTNMVEEILAPAILQEKGE